MDYDEGFKRTRNAPGKTTWPQRKTRALIGPYWALGPIGPWALLDALWGYWGSLGSPVDSLTLLKASMGIPFGALWVSLGLSMGPQVGPW